VGSGADALGEARVVLEGGEGAGGGDGVARAVTADRVEEVGGGRLAAEQGEGEVADAVALLGGGADAPGGERIERGGEPGAAEGERGDLGAIVVLGEALDDE